MNEVSRMKMLNEKPQQQKKKKQPIISKFVQKEKPKFSVFVQFIFSDLGWAREIILTIRIDLKRYDTYGDDVLNVNVKIDCVIHWLLRLKSRPSKASKVRVSPAESL